MSGSPSIAGIMTQSLVVGVAEYAVARDTQLTLSTYALGSCIGIIAYDPAVKAGGLLHFMLPDSALSPEKAASRPAMFADTGIPMLFSALNGLGASRSRLRIYLAGGASVLSGPDNFKIGARNIKAAHQILNVFGCRVAAEDCAGFVNRTLHLKLETGLIKLKEPGRLHEFTLN